MTPDILAGIQAFVLAVFTGLTVYVVPRIFNLFCNYLDAKAEKLKNSEKRSSEDFALQRLDLTVKNVVAELQQTRITGVLLTEDEAKKLKEIAVFQIKKHLSEDLQKTIERVIKDLDGYIVTKVEAEVLSLKLKIITAECR